MNAHQRRKARRASGRRRHDTIERAVLSVLQTHGARVFGWAPPLEPWAVKSPAEIIGDVRTFLSRYEQTPRPDPMRDVKNPAEIIKAIDCAVRRAGAGMPIVRGGVADLLRETQDVGHAWAQQYRLTAPDPLQDVRGMISTVCRDFEVTHPAPMTLRVVCPPEHAQAVQNLLDQRLPVGVRAVVMPARWLTCRVCGRQGPWADYPFQGPNCNAPDCVAF